MKTSNDQPLCWLQRQHNATLNHLTSHKIPFEPATEPGWVLIASPGRAKVLLKLLKDQKTNHWLFELAGTASPMSCHPKTFLAIWSCKKNWLANTTKTKLLFGKYEGQTIAEAWAQEPGYLVALVKGGTL